MSRCYPFPVLNEIKYKCLIESIKAAEEVKKDRKHKRKDKKRKERENEAGRSRKHKRKRRRKDEGANASGKLTNNKVEFLDKSCQTVELELQTSSQNSCDSTLHSNEKPMQIQSQPLDETGIHTRLPDKGQKDSEPEVMMTDNNQKQRFFRERFDVSQAATPNGSVGSTTQDASRVCEQEKPSSSHQETIGPSKLLCRKCPPSVATQFLSLIENWAPDRVESKLTDSEDQEWWSSIKSGAKRQQVGNQKTNQGSSSMGWPTARFLLEVDLYALPFTVPF